MDGVITLLSSLISIEFDIVLGVSNSANIIWCCNVPQVPHCGMDKPNIHKVSLPPLAEQRCIVAKLEELLPFWDKLKK